MNDKYVGLSILRPYWLNLLLILSLFAIPASVSSRVLVSGYVQPHLLHLATTQPNEVVRVLIQQQDVSIALSELIHRFGGRIVRNLNFINTLVAELPAKTIPILAQRKGVRYISLDGAVRSTAEFTRENDYAYTGTDAINWTLSANAEKMRQSVDNATFITWATELGTVSDVDMVNAYDIVDEVGLGPDGYYGYHTGNGKAAFSGFTAEVVPNHAISKVEVVLPTFVNTLFNKDFKVKIYVGGTKSGEVRVKTDIFQNVVGAAKADLVYVDISTSRTWRWADFQNNLQIAIETGGMSKEHTIYYDAVGLRIMSQPGIDSTANDLPIIQSLPKTTVDTSKLINVFPFVVRATDVWNAAPNYLQGQAMTIAVIDSGISKSEDLKGRNVKDVNFNEGYHDSKDRYGHGTFVASMIAGDGKQSNGAYLGIAPQSQLLNIRVSDDQGMAYESDVIAALEWIYTNKGRYNIRVANLSLNANDPMSYHLSPLNAAVELLWFNGIVVVVAAGNNGTADLFPPANDPFVITVGATDDQGTQTVFDDVVGSFSAYGKTLDGHLKPDLVAPGRNIVMHLPHNSKLIMGKRYPSHRINDDYFRMSGTSLAAPIVAGSVALLLQNEPTLTPDQVKFRLMATANKNWPGYLPDRAGAGYLDIYAAVNGTTTANSNTGIFVSQLLWSGADPVTWGSVSWNSVSWNSVSWNSVSWNSVSWNSVSWHSDHWDEGVMAANSSDEGLNAQGLPIPINVGEDGLTSDKEQKWQLFLPLIDQS